MAFPRVSVQHMVVLVGLTVLLLGIAPATWAEPAGPGFTADPPTVIFINELHYDNVSGDTDEAVEIAAPTGMDVAALRVVLYNNGVEYGTLTLEQPAGQCGDYDLYVVTPSSIQNGPNDGLALIDDDAASVLQLLSYEGTFTATEGIAAGLTSTDIGVEEGNGTPVGHSLQLSGEGGAYDDFTWQAPAAATWGACNNDQVLGAPPTLVGLRDFTATVLGGQVLLTWETTIEIDNVGFYLYRAASEAGERTRLNADLIASEALPGEGARYQWVDEPGPGQHLYWLEDVDTANAATQHGPIEATVIDPRANATQAFLPVVQR